MPNSKAEVQVQYSKCIVAYLDILGFKALIKDPEKLQAIYQMMQIVDIVTDVENYKTQIEIGKLQISDGLLFWAEVEHLGNLVVFLSKIGFAISTLHSAGILTRGAISYGNHFFKNGILISPAFIEAFEHESKISKFPRTIFSTSALKAVLDLAKKEPDEDLALVKFSVFTKLDVDGYQFVDYLHYLTIIFDPVKKKATVASPKELEELFGRHKVVVERSIRQTDNEDIRSKYIWLGNYQNKYVESDDQLKDKMSCLVDPDLLIQAPK